MTGATARYRLSFCPDGAVLAGARDCEADVFLRTYGNTEAEFDFEYGPYEGASRFIALTDSDGTVVGACRIIMPSVAGLKTVNDVSRAPWSVDGTRAVKLAGAELAKSWDVATVAVRPDPTITPLASAALYHGLVMATRANGIRWIVMMLDERARRLLSIAGFVARPIPGTGPAPYLGSPTSTPLVGEVAAMIDFQRRTNPEAYRLMSLGSGLINIEVPPLAQWVVTDPVRSRDEVPGLARTA